VQDRQGLADLAGFLAPFEVDDKPQAGAGGQRQILLRDAQLFPGFPDDLAEVLWRVFHGLTINITVREYCRLFWPKVNELLPYGNIKRITVHIMSNIPVR
jgi:hypothetical protein